MIEWVLIHSRTAGEWIPSLRTEFSSISFIDWFPLHGQYRRRHTCLVNTKVNSLKRSKKKQAYHKYLFLNFILEMDVHMVEQDSNVTWANGHARLVHISGFLLEFERQILEARGKAGWKLPKSAEGDGFGLNSVNAKETILNEYEWISTCIHAKKNRFHAFLMKSSVAKVNRRKQHAAIIPSTIPTMKILRTVPWKGYIPSRFLSQIRI